MPGAEAKPILAVSYSRRVYDGDFESPRNSSVFRASADVKGPHYHANAVFSEVLQAPVHRLQFGQALSISHPAAKGFEVSGEIWRFMQLFLRTNALGNLWAVSYAARRNVLLDAGFEKGLTSTSTTGKCWLAKPTYRLVGYGRQFR